MATYQLALVPRDGLFLKDGRGWHTSSSGRGHSLDWPFPPTMLGALRTTVGRVLERAAPGGRFDGSAFLRETGGVSLGSMLALRRPQGHAAWSAEHRMWPVPADALYLRDDDHVRALQPEPPRAPTLGRDDDPAREALWSPRSAGEEKPEDAPRWWTEEDFVAWLGEGKIRKHSDREKEALKLTRRVDVHLAIDAKTLAAREGMLFASDTIEPMSVSEDGQRWEWAIGLAAELPAPVAIDALAWTVGGDRRVARADAMEGSAFTLPAPAAFATSTLGLRLMMVTPALFAEGWIPDGFSVRDGAYRGELPGVAGQLVLRAALVPRPVNMSGWDMVAKGPKATSRLVPPGAVYFFEKTAVGASFSAAEVESLWLAAVGGKTNEGLGRVVAGRWTPKAT